MEAIVYLCSLMAGNPLTYDNYLSLAIRFDKQVVRRADFQPLLDYLHSSQASTLCPTQIDKDFTAERELELASFLTRVRRTEEAAIVSLLQIQLKQELKQEVPDSTTEDMSAINGQTIFQELREDLIDKWKMGEDQAAASLQLLMRALADLPSSLPRLRADYSGVPDHRELYRREMCNRLRDWARKSGHGEDDEKGEKTKVTMESIRYRTRPVLVREMRSFCALVAVCLGELPDVAAAQGMLALLNSPCQGQALTARYPFTDQLADTFESLTASLAAMGSLKPPGVQVPMIVYTGLADGCLCSLVVQRQGEECHVPVSLYARRLSPEEQRLTRLEKEALAVLWAVAVNHSVLHNEKNVTLAVSDSDVYGLFTDMDVVTQVWPERLAAAMNPSKDSAGADVTNPTPPLDLIRPEDNPALALGSGMAVRILPTAMYSTVDLLVALFEELLKACKRGGADRAKWLRQQVRLERRRHQEGLNRLGRGDDDDEEEEIPATEMSQEGGQDEVPVTSHPESGSPTMNGEPRAGTVEGPNLDFIAVASTSMDVNVPSVDEDTAMLEITTEKLLFPACTVPEFQPIFEAYLRFLLDEKQTPYDKAVVRSQAAVAEHFFHLEEPVTYDQLRELVRRLKLEQYDRGTSVGPEQVHRALDLFLDSRGVARLNCREDIIRVVADHFFYVLQIRPNIRVNITARRASDTASSRGQLRSVSVSSPHDSDHDDDDDSEEKPAETIPVARGVGKHGGGEPCWFQEMLDSELGASSVLPASGPSLSLGVNWSDSQSLLSPMKRSTGPGESQQQGAGFEGLERYYDQMIRHQPDREQRAAYRQCGMTGAVLGNCWRLTTCSTFERLASCYRMHADMGPGQLEQQLRQLLQQNDQAAKFISHFHQCCGCKM